MTARFLALFPELTGSNGDVQNALVLARRAQWAGIEAEATSLAVGAVPEADPTVIVLGSASDPTLPRLLAALTPIRERLAAWIAAGIPLLAIGTGAEALGERLLLPDGPVDGIGLLPVEAVPLDARVAGDLVVRTPQGDLVGYENHARGLRLRAGADALGTVLRGTGDGTGTDGVRHGSVIGTRLHGPVLAKNPAFADALLATALRRDVRVVGGAAEQADASAARLRAALLAGR